MANTQTKGDAKS